jgi:hypothetical protein
MNTVPIINANEANYWPEVRRKTARRTALQYVKQVFATTPCGMIYERWVSEIMEAVQDAARRADFFNNIDEYTDFRRECADVLKLPELADSDPCELARQAQEAVQDAAEALYGC